MLDQVALTGFVRAGVAHEPAYGVALVEAGEDQLLRGVLASPGAGFLLLDHVDELLHQLEHARLGPHVIPHVGDGEVGRVGLVAGALVEALVKGQEDGLGFGQPGGHVDQVGVHGEVGEASLEAEEGLAGVTVGLVLMDGVLDVGRRHLELDGEKGHAVDEEGHVEQPVFGAGLVAAPLQGAVAELAHDGEHVGLVEACVFFVERGLGLEVDQVEMTALVRNALAQHVDRAVPVDLLADAFDEGSAMLAAGVLDPELLPLLELRRFQEVDEDVFVEAEVAVEMLGRPRPVALLDQGGFDGGFEVLLGGVDGSRVLWTISLSAQRIALTMKRQVNDCLGTGRLCVHYRGLGDRPV